MVKVKQSNPDWLKKLVKNYKSNDVLAVGFPVGTSGVSTRYPDGESVLMVAAVNNFGANIKHPGGTRYYVDKSGKAVFVSNDFVGPTMGVTKPHIIPIPARPFMTEGFIPAVKVTQPIKERLVPLLNQGKITVKQILEHMGAPAANSFKNTILTGNWVPNRPSTIARKDSSRPLTDTGLMRQTLTYVVRGKA